MQPAGVNALLALVAAPAQGASANILAGADADGNSAAGQAFSQLLSDSGKQYEDPQASQQLLLQGKIGAPTALSAITAQEVPATPADLIAELLQARGQTVTEDTAGAVVTRLNAMAQNFPAPAEAQAIAEIKQQLVAIGQGAAPKTIAEILQAAPSLKQAKLPLMELTAVLAQRKLTEATVAETREAPETALMPFVPAAMFRPRNADGQKPPAPKKDQPAQEELSDAATPTPLDAGSVTVIEPLAASLNVVIPVLTPANAAPSISDGVNASNISGAVSANRARRDIDSAIPPLTQATDNDDELPAVFLPKLAADSSVEKTDRTGTVESLAASATANEKAESSAALDKNNTTLSALFNPSHTDGLSPTQTISAAQPVSVVPTYAYMNHAPVSDQVHVALKKAEKDGIEHLTIQLDPVDLGRVEVRMHKNLEGQTQISFTVDRPETFDSLSRDARHLERSLQEAGIKADTGSMQFNLRQQPQPQLHSDMNGERRPNQQQASADDASATPIQNVNVAGIAMDATTRNYLFNVREGVDISA